MPLSGCRCGSARRSSCRARHRSDGRTGHPSFAPSTRPCSPRPSCSTPNSAARLRRRRDWHPADADCRSRGRTQATARRGSDRRRPTRSTHANRDTGRVVDVLVGPAGAGKTTAMNALRHAWEQVNGGASVIGLAPSAVAAHVLAEDLGVATENLAKWWHDHRYIARPSGPDNS